MVKRTGYSWWRAIPLGAALALGPAVATAPDRATAQIPDVPQNLQVLDEDISRDSLISVMRGFSFALGVRCEYCHVGSETGNLNEMEFHRDDDEDKRKARFMLRLVETMNTSILPLLPERDEPPVRVQCETCHHGLPRPQTLGEALIPVAEAEGPEAVVARYRELRQQYEGRGTYDFGQWEVNEIASTLAERGQHGPAVALLELNREYYPESPNIAFMLGQLFEQMGERERAVESYRATLELNPEFQAAQRRLDALTGG